MIARATATTAAAGHEPATAEAPGRRASLSAVAVALLALLAVVVAALATATALRPRAGYTSTLHLLGALALGASAALLVLLALAALIAVLRRTVHLRGPLLRGVVLAALAAALLLAASVQALRTSAEPALAPAQPAAAAAFSRWQQRVVPLVVAYVSVLRGDAALVRALPRTGRQAATARARLSAGAKTLRRLRPPAAPSQAATATEATLARLSGTLASSLRLARRGQAALAAGFAAMAAAPAARSAGRNLVAEAKRDLRNSQQAMAAFALEANALGAQLNANR